MAKANRAGKTATSLNRFLKIDRSKINKENRTVELAFSSETPVERWGENEVLSHDKGEYDFSRIADGSHPLMAGHNESNPDDQIGVIESARVDGDKIARCIARFGNSERADQYFKDVTDGIRSNVSVGYDRTGIVRSNKAADGMTTTVYRWMPTHVAIVPVPADTRAGVGRNKREEITDDDGLCLICGSKVDEGASDCQNCGTAVPERSKAQIDSTPKVNLERISQLLTPDQKENMKRILFAPDAAAGGGAAAPVIDPLVSERNRVKEITKVSEQLLKDRPEAREKVVELTTRAISTDMSLGDYQIAAMRECLNAKPAVTRSMATEGIDVKQYNFMRGIRSCIERNSPTPDGYEGEVHRHFASKMTREKPVGFIVPFDAPGYVQPIRRNRRGGRDLQSNVFGQGGATVATETFTPIIEILRNRMKCIDFGVQTMAGLEGNVVIPRQTAAATAYSVPEIGALTGSTQALDQIALTPRRVGAYNQYSKQLLLQSSIDVENFVRDDLMKVLAIDIDRLILNGQGGNSEPLGIMNTPGIGSIVFGGTATWQKIVQFETTVASQNADIGVMGYLTTPSSKGQLKSVAKLLIGATTVAAVPLWDGMLGDGSADGEMNGYRAGSTNQIPNNQLLFGVFDQAILAMWGGYDVVVNPYSLDTQAEVRITCNVFIDVAIRHPQSFCVSADPANQ